MKAVVLHDYGSIDHLSFEEVADPIPNDDQLRIAVHYSTLTAGDCELRRFDVSWLFWLPLRLISGVIKPKQGILGQEISGVIDMVGKNVTNYSVGEEVFGSTDMFFGGHGEFKVLDKNHPLAFKPAGISHKEAVTLPVGGINALHFLRLANIRPGERVLIYGATGSIGTYAVQIAREMGAEVTAICSEPNLDLIRSLGAIEVIDYKKEKFWEREIKYDVVFEAVGKTSYASGIKVLKPKGRYVLTNPSVRQMLRTLVTNLMGKHKAIMKFADPKKKDLEHLAMLLSQGKIKAVTDREYALKDVPEAHRYVEQGTKCGHVIIKVLTQ